MSSADQRLVFDGELADFAAAETCAPQPGAASVAETAAMRRRAQARFRKITSLCGVAADFFASAMAVLACEMLFHAGWRAAQAARPMEAAAAPALLAGLFVVLLGRRARTQAGGGSLLQIRETERALRSSAAALLLLGALSFVLPLSLSLTAVLAASFAMPAFLIAEKQALGAVVRALHRRGRGVERVVVYGAGGAGRRVVSALFNSPELGMRPVAVIDDGTAPPAGWMVALGYRGRGSVPVRRGPETGTLLEDCACDALVIASENAMPEHAAALARAAERMGIRVVQLVNSSAPEWQPAECLHLDGLLLTSIADEEPRVRYVTAKRASDLILASALLVLLSPLLVAIALWVWLDSRGPALFQQMRVGREGRIFKILKFRTMTAGAPRYDLSPANPSDARITRAGRFLRRTSLDELPQLFNVLAGDMSLVGPRPEMPFLVERHLSKHQPRLQVLPGITGLWQLSADRQFRIHENVHYDLYYIRNRTFFLDAAILIHTLFFAMHGV